MLRMMHPIGMYKYIASIASIALAGCTEAPPTYPPHAIRMPEIPPARACATFPRKPLTADSVPAVSTPVFHKP